MGTGWDRLFIFDLEEGVVRHVDLSWAYASGPAKARESDLIMRSLGWLGCAAWSPVDKTQVAIWVIVRNAHWKNPSKRKQMIREEYRVVLLDIEAKTGRLLAVRNDACSELDWSPDGTHLILDGYSGDEYLNVKTGEAFSIDLPRRSGEEDRTAILADWNPNSEKLLVRKQDVDGKDAVFTYDIGDRRLSRSLGVFTDTMQVSEYAPHGTSQDTLNFLIRQYSHTSYHSDIWLYRQVSDEVERLTRDGTPKWDIRSYHGGLKSSLKK
jgi:Tol biopolymer transport system component